ncbi:hypothetical protein N0V83_009485 [Neocucurbitaria cava]|uniref:Uncharacterized protein n=1 Tax=Neocucurbitaria cava TaxID=798079 RepID=A0A9W8Y0P5_9PLEO|nr:hypothetical protein N0V83_009485 [Neocucurbitaria cava]
MCEISHVVLAESLRAVEQGRSYKGCRVNVRGIFKLRFTTIRKYNDLHCAFLVIFHAGGLYVFDPTGIQFGPDWPLLSPFREDSDAKMDPNSPIEVRRL